MSLSTWTVSAVASEARRWAGKAWRIVEAQHVASTMKLVDSSAEQDMLEQLLEEGSKPPVPVSASELDYLLASPFRYRAIRGGSRFRGSRDPGVYYGAERVKTACAELGYWRWCFLMDAEDLDRLEPVAHTAFSVSIDCLAIDLRKPPFVADRAAWIDPVDYNATQDMALLAREANVTGIVYESVRDPEPAWCIVLLDPAGFAQSRPDVAVQSWWLTVNREGVLWRRDTVSHAFSAERWRRKGGS